MSREIMQQALDAFEDLKKSVTRDGTVSENWDAYYEKEYYALEALRQALAQPEQEPYCWVQSKLNQGLFYKEKPRRIHTIPLYAAPPKREWVGLTDDEVEFIADSEWEEAFVRLIEAKLKEKNGAL